MLRAKKNHFGVGVQNIGIGEPPQPMSNNAVGFEMSTDSSPYRQSTTRTCTEKKRKAIPCKNATTTPNIHCLRSLTSSPIRRVSIKAINAMSCETACSTVFQCSALYTILRLEDEQLTLQSKLRAPRRVTVGKTSSSCLHRKLIVEGVFLVFHVNDPIYWAITCQ